MVNFLKRLNKLSIFTTPITLSMTKGSYNPNCGCILLKEYGLDFGYITNETIIVTAIGLSNALSDWPHSNIYFTGNLSFNSLSDFFIYLNDDFNITYHLGGSWYLNGTELYYSNKEHFQNGNITFTEIGRRHSDRFNNRHN